MTDPEEREESTAVPDEGRDGEAASGAADGDEGPTETVVLNALDGLVSDRESVLADAASERVLREAYEEVTEGGERERVVAALDSLAADFDSGEGDENGDTAGDDTADEALVADVVDRVVDALSARDATFVVDHDAPLDVDASACAVYEFFESRDPDLLDAVADDDAVAAALERGGEAAAAGDLASAADAFEDAVDAADDAESGTTGDTDTQRGTTGGTDTQRGTSGGTDTERGTSGTADTERGTADAVDDGSHAANRGSNGTDAGTAARVLAAWAHHSDGDDERALELVRSALLRDNDYWPARVVGVAADHSNPEWFRSGRMTSEAYLRVRATTPEAASVDAALVDGDGTAQWLDGAAECFRVPSLPADGRVRLRLRGPPGELPGLHVYYLAVGVVEPESARPRSVEQILLDGPTPAAGSERLRIDVS